MRRAAFLALFLAATAAQAQEPTYAMVTWQQAGIGRGQVRAWGPLATGFCNANLGTIATLLSKDISPDLRLAVRVCAPQSQLQEYVSAYRCAPVSRSHNKGDAQVWVYECIGP